MREVLCEERKVWLRITEEFGADASLSAWCVAHETGWFAGVMEALRILKDRLNESPYENARDALLHAADEVGGLLEPEAEGGA